MEDVEKAKEWLKKTLNYIREDIPEVPMVIQKMKYNNIKLAVDNIEKSMNNYEPLSLYWKTCARRLNEIKNEVAAYRHFLKDIRNN